MPVKSEAKFCFHSKYSLQNAKSEMSIYSTNIVAIKTRRTENAVVLNLVSIAGSSWGQNRLYKPAPRQRQVRVRCSFFDSYNAVSTVSKLQSMDASGVRKEKTAPKLSSWWNWENIHSLQQSSLPAGLQCVSESTTTASESVFDSNHILDHTDKGTPEFFSKRSGRQWEPTFCTTEYFLKSCVF